jgi:hypothetical protein
MERPRTVCGVRVAVPGTRHTPSRKRGSPGADAPELHSRGGRSGRRRWRGHRLLGRGRTGLPVRVDLRRVAAPCCRSMHEQRHDEAGEGACDETGDQPRKNGHGRELLPLPQSGYSGWRSPSGAGQTKTQRCLPPAGPQAGSLFVRNRRTFSRYGVGCVCSQQRSPVL